MLIAFFLMIFFGQMNYTGKTLFLLYKLFKNNIITILIISYMHSF